MRIYKYKLESYDGFAVRMRKGAKILSLQVQGGTACIWAVVDDLAPEITRKLIAVDTGDNVPNPQKFDYIDMALFHGGTYVVHYFIEKEVE